MITASLEWKKQLMLNTSNSAILPITNLILNKTRKGYDVLMLHASLSN